MSKEIPAEPVTALLAWLAYQNLWVAESLIAHQGVRTELGDRLTVARLSSDALCRFTAACDAIPGGQSAAQEAMAPMLSPVDEFWTMTKPRVQVEQRLRLLVLASIVSELRFPLNNRYFDKLSRFLGLSQENPALRHQLDEVVVRRH